jgi:hypothetical protein
MFSHTLLEELQVPSDITEPSERRSKQAWKFTLAYRRSEIEQARRRLVPFDARLRYTQKRHQHFRKSIGEAYRCGRES